MIQEIVENKTTFAAFSSSTPYNSASDDITAALGHAASAKRDTLNVSSKNGIK